MHTMPKFIVDSKSNQSGSVSKMRPLHHNSQSKRSHETVRLTQNKEEEPILRDKESARTGKTKITHSSPGGCLDEATT